MKTFETRKHLQQLDHILRLKWQEILYSHPARFR